MNFYYVCASDQLFGGSLGMSYDCIIEGNEGDAMEAGSEMSIEVIESFSCITDWLEEIVKDAFYDKTNIDLNCQDIEDCDDELLDLYTNIKDEVYYDDIDYFYVLLDKEKLPTIDPYKLDDILIKMGSEEFLETYRYEE